MDNTQLPAEVVEEIKQLAQLSTDFLSNDETLSKDYLNGYKQGWEYGGKEYATKLHMVQQELNGAKECLKLLTSSYKELEAENKDNNKNRKEAMRLLFRLASLINAGHKPNEKFLTEIKTFLDGSK